MAGSSTQWTEPVAGGPVRTHAYLATSPAAVLGRTLVTTEATHTVARDPLTGILTTVQVQFVGASRMALIGGRLIPILVPDLAGRLVEDGASGLLVIRTDPEATGQWYLKDGAGFLTPGTDSVGAATLRMVDDWWTAVV